VILVLSLKGKNQRNFKKTTIAKRQKDRKEGRDNAHGEKSIITAEPGIVPKRLKAADLFAL